MPEITGYGDTPLWAKIILALQLLFWVAWPIAMLVTS